MEGGVGGRREGGKREQTGTAYLYKRERACVKRVGQEIKVRIFVTTYLICLPFLPSLLSLLFSPFPQRREKGKMRVHKLQNVQTALSFLQKEKKVWSPDKILALTHGNIN